ncbi:hairy and enhancer of split-related protein helt [Syngnathus scovelli]|uniref:hairy and enhancer of split-related protein helt n=1 Tax=Syngnathus scovelli TaxID=161590 RepID=UPI00211030CC|nr:hairy and enhancer of split-related protein helt [Syngnathus scovelli]
MVPSLIPAWNNLHFGVNPPWMSPFIRACLVFHCLHFVLLSTASRLSANCNILEDLGEKIFSFMASRMKERKRTPISHKVIEKRRRDRINRCLNELGKTVPMALAKQNSGKLEKAEILEMTVQYLRALHSADFPRGREKGELLTEFANYFHYGYHECMKNLVHYLTTEDRAETKDIKYARILAFLQSKSRAITEPVFGSAGPDASDYLGHQLHSSPEHQSLHSPTEMYQHHHQQQQQQQQQSPPRHLAWHGSARGPAISYPPAVALSAAHAQQHGGYLSPVQGLEHHHYFNLLGHAHHNTFTLHSAQHAM